MSAIKKKKKKINLMKTSAAVESGLRTYLLPGCGGGGGGTINGTVHTHIFFFKHTLNKFLSVMSIDIEYNKRLDRQRPCLEGDFNGGSNNIVQSNKSV